MHTRFLILTLAPLLLLAACQPEARTTPPSDSLEDRSGYILGHEIGMAFHEQVDQLGERNVQLTEEAIMSGFRAGLRGDTLPYTDQEVQATMQAFQDTVQARVAAFDRVAGEERRGVGQQFLEEYSRQEGVTTTESGLRIRVLEEGEGRSPLPADEVLVHYEGRFPDGEVFDSSLQRGEPVRFPVQGVVPGFAEALQHMEPGGRYEIVLPPELAYGDDAPPRIGPGRTLIFVVNLLDVFPAGQS